MKLVSLACVALMAVVGLANSSGAGQKVVFKRSYKEKAVAQYTMTLDVPDAGKLTAEIQTTVNGVNPNGATIVYKTLSLKVGDQAAPPDSSPDLTSKVGAEAMPNEIDFMKGVPYFAVSAAGIVPNSTFEVGADMPIHWENNAKDVTLEGHGKLSSIDATANTVSVDWDFTVTPKGQDKGQFKVTSVYSSSDFSLKSSKGKIDIGGKVADFTVNRSETK